tara:strand:- start:2052 stop:2747 length:696 start_codon:yes stop_codon:yes gene_type:complete
MTRLPPYTDEPARTEAVMAEVRRTIHMHLHNTRRRKLVDGDVNLLTAAAGIEARWAELNPQSVSAPSALAPEQAAAGTPNPTAASLFLSAPSTNFNSFKSMLTQSDEVGFVLIDVDGRRQSGIGRVIGNVLHPIKSPDFSPDFLSNVKHADGTSVYIRRKECAFICAVSLDWFDRNVQSLMDEHAFPQPRDPKGQRRWSRADVKVWATSHADDDTLARARSALRKTLEKQA